MQKKVPISLQMFLSKLLIGFIVPTFLMFTGYALVDKILWKIAISLAFFVATLIVGLLYSAKIISGKVSGGKTRLRIFIILIFIFYAIITQIIAFIKSIPLVGLHYLLPQEQEL